MTCLRFGEGLAVEDLCLIHGSVDYFSLVPWISLSHSITQGPVLQRWMLCLHLQIGLVGVHLVHDPCL